ncbi:uncharacterized protein LOC134221259 [Armigeres subalbatus]|uniref:uncharacterized protein LOC134221259 n=1 Tax=Armigeres subalbatus TaxID=124917 RepID=UPI002ED4F506
MDSSDEEYFASSSTINFLMGTGREFAIHPINRNRKRDGEFYRLYDDLREYPEKFRSFTRMDMDTFDVILSLIERKLMKNWTNCNREPILPCERLIITIRFLATGSSFTTLGFSFRMGRSTVAAIVTETCQVLWDTLQPIYMPAPTEQMFKLVADEYWQKWNFPNCIGAIDGKHIRMRCPPGSGSMYYNYKGYHSTVLQAVADANSKFLMVEIGGYGKQSDAGTFSSSDMYQLLIKGKLNVPPDALLPDNELTMKMPYVFVGDEAYPLVRHLIRPYPRNQLTTSLAYFNSRLSRARKCVECAFGIMSSKWRILLKPIETSPKLGDDIVKAICILHNVIIDHEGVSLQLEEAADYIGRRTDNVSTPPSKISTNSGRFIRDYFKGFMTRNTL